MHFYGERVTLPRTSCFYEPMFYSAGSPSRPQSANLSAQALLVPQDLKPFPGHLIHNVNGNDSTAPLKYAGCYKPSPTTRHISPQHATIALGNIARAKDFYSSRVFDNYASLQTVGSVVIFLIKSGKGDDVFSIYDIVSQAFNIINYCVFQQLPGEQLGGQMELMLASYHTHPALVRYLLDQGADPNTLNERGQSVLAGAVFKAAAISVPPSGGGEEGEREGEEATKSPEDEIIELLLRGGADVDLGRPSAREAVGVFRVERWRRRVCGGEE
ncbi:MAG: hypothetical protein Q9220_003042 [cf. Caloplaca sp. 1 TL-2023]